MYYFREVKMELLSELLPLDHPNGVRSHTNILVPTVFTSFLSIKDPHVILSWFHK